MAPPDTAQWRVRWDKFQGQWVVTHNRDAFRWARTKRQAVRLARAAIAFKKVPAELTIYKRNGQHQEGRTYFRDDARSPG